MTSTAFHELIQRLKTESLRSPGTHRAKHLALTALGHLYVSTLLVLALVFLALATTGLLNGNILEASGHALSGLIAGSLCLAATRLRLPHPEGRRLLRGDAPQLFTVIDKIRHKLGAPSVHQVVVNDVFGTTILQAPRLGIFGWNHNTLVVGLPLMQALSRKEFAAILAHEYAHISRQHGRLDAWIHRTHLMWKHVGNGLDPNPGYAGRVLTGFLRWYIPMLNAFSAVRLHQDELEVDLIAAAVVGHQTMADALIAQALRGRFLEERFWQGLWSRADHQPAPPFLPHASMRTALSRGISTEESTAWLTEAMQRDSEPHDTHPGLRERVLALDTGSELPPDAVHSAAQSLLGDLLPALQQDFDERWQAHNIQAWRLRFHAVTSARETVHRMEHRSVEQLSPEELAHLGLAFETLGRCDDALPLLRLAAEHPNGPAEAALATARLLRARNDCSATHYMETALRRNPGLARHRAEPDPFAGLAAASARHARQHAA